MCWISLHFSHSLRNLRQPAELRRISLQVILPSPKGLVMTTSSSTLPSATGGRVGGDTRVKGGEFLVPGVRGKINVPSLGVASVSKSIMESTEPNKSLLKLGMGGKRFWKLKKGSRNRDRMLLPQREYVGYKGMWNMEGL